MYNFSLKNKASAGARLKQWYMALISFFISSDGFCEISSNLLSASAALDIGMPFVAEMASEGMRIVGADILGDFSILCARARLAQGNVDGAINSLKFVPNYFLRSDYAINNSIASWILGNRVAYFSTIFNWRECDFTNERDIYWYKFFKRLCLNLQMSYIIGVNRVGLCAEDNILNTFEKMFIEAEIDFNAFNFVEFSNKQILKKIDGNLAKKYTKLLFQRKKFSELIKFANSILKHKIKISFSDKIRILYIKAVAQIKLGQSIDETVLSASNFAKNDTLIFVELLRLWLNSAENIDSDAKISFLSKILEKCKRLAYIGDIKLIKAEVRMAMNQLDVARNIINNCISLPNCINKFSAYLLLAKTYFVDKTPNYRLAADFLKEAKKYTNDDVKKFNLTATIGNLLFLSNDYTLAYNFYNEAISKLPIVFNQKIPVNVIEMYCISSILAKNERTGDDLIQFFKNNNISIEKYLNLEKIYIEQMLINKTFEKALARIDYVLNYASDFFELFATFTSMKAYALLEVGDNLSAKKFLDKIDIKKISDHKLTARIKIIYGQLFNALSEHSSALSYFEDVCKMDNVGEELHSVAFFSAANIYAHQKIYMRSQQLLLSLFEKYSNAAFSPLSLYQAAIYCSQKGLSYAKETAEILNIIVEKFPNSPICYSAQIKQGQLLMELNKFSEARLFFKNMLKSLPNNEKKHFCEFLELKCALMAEAENKAEIAQKLNILLSNSTYSKALAFEISALLANLYFELDKHVAGIQLIWAQVFDFQNLKQYDNKEAYWISKCLFLLAEHLEKVKMTYDAMNAYKFIVDNQLPGLQIAATKIEFIKNE